jgi:excinuclease UvrABC ATPase subunit
MFSYNSKHGWCTTCVGTGLALTREQRKAYDDSVRDDDSKGREQSFPAEEAEVEGVVDEPCPDCGGTRLNLVSSRGAHRSRARTSSEETGAPCWMEAIQVLRTMSVAENLSPRGPSASTRV